MSIFRMGRYIPQTVREWDRLFAPLNQVIKSTEVGVTVEADNLPASDALYLTLSNNSTLPNDRVLRGVEGEITLTDYGAGSQLTAGLADEVKAVLPLSGTGSPEGVVTASPGRLYLNLSGGVSTTLYVKTSGIETNTGWTAK